MSHKLLLALLASTALCGAAIAQTVPSETAQATPETAQAAPTDIGRVTGTLNKAPNGVPLNLPSGDTRQEFGGGLIPQEDAPKGRSTITRDFLEKQSPTQNPFQAINLLPGVNSFSNDATGTLGGGFTIRGFNSDQIGVTVEGVPVNDSGNFAVFPQEYIDGQNVGSVTVTQGSTDLDAPHIGATGGQVNIVLRDPSDEFGVRQVLGFGSLNEKTTFTRLDTGLIGNTKGFVSVSHSEVNKFKGLGTVDKNHVDLKTVTQLNSGDRISFVAIYNSADSDFVRNPTLSQFKMFGRNFDYDDTFNPKNPSSNFYKLNINPFRNAQLVATGNFRLADNLQLDVTPYFFYGFGNGGGARTITENNLTNPNAVGNGATSVTKLPATDLNGNGTKTDTLLAYNPSITETFRPGLYGKLNYQLDNHRAFFGYLFESAFQYQTAPFSLVNPDGTPNGEFGQDANIVVNGQKLERRNQDTITTTNQFFLGDEATFFNDALKIGLGLKQVFVQRDGFDHLPNSTPRRRLADDESLPGLSVNYKYDDRHSAFFNFSTSFRSPPNFVLFDNSNKNPKAESAVNFDLGFRYDGDIVRASVTGFANNFNNRQVSTQLPDRSLTTINVGRTLTRGVEAELGTAPIGNFRFFGSYTFLSTQFVDNFQAFNTSGVLVRLPTKGKTVPRAPENLLAFNADYDTGDFFTNLTIKYTGRQFSTFTNDEQIGAFTVADISFGYRLPNFSVAKQPEIKFFINNISDNKALSGVNSVQTNAVTTNGVAGSAPNYNVLPSRFFGVSFSSNF